jgi:cyclic pyranopterin phosphate synthase
MEAMCAGAVAGATIYDMIKAVDPAASIGPFQLVEKQGGKGGPWANTKTPPP